MADQLPGMTGEDTFTRSVNTIRFANRLRTLGYSTDTRYDESTRVAVVRSNAPWDVRRNVRVGQCSPADVTV